MTILSHTNLRRGRRNTRANLLVVWMASTCL